MTIEQIHQLFLGSTGVVTDTRQIKPGNIYFALKGERFNGNDFAQEALQKGCAYSVVDEGEESDSGIIKVDDVLSTLQALANFHRKKMNARILSITGTNGKTTTKELVSKVLSSRYNIIYTQGNLNNHIGVPLTLLNLNKDTEIAIVEMGANHPGEIDFLCKIAEPDFGLITNIGKAHLEGFGSFEGVINTKTELYRFLQKTGGHIFYNCDNPILSKHVANIESTSYGNCPPALTKGKVEESWPLLKVKWTLAGNDEQFIVESNLFGIYNTENILAAVCVGSYFNILPHEINKAIASYVPGNNRSQVLKTDKNTLVLDAYNANPTSMRASINNFDKSPVKPKALIIGDMLELGNDSLNEHEQILSLVQQCSFDKVILVGQLFSELNSEYLHFETTDEARLYLENNPMSGFTVLIKASRGIGLEKLTAVL